MAPRLIPLTLLIPQHPYSTFVSSCSCRPLMLKVLKMYLCLWVLVGAQISRHLHYTFIELPSGSDSCIHVSCQLVVALIGQLLICLLTISMLMILHPCFMLVGSCLDRTVNCRSLNLRCDPGLILLFSSTFAKFACFCSRQGSRSITFLATEIDHFLLIALSTCDLFGFVMKFYQRRCPK